MPRLRTDQVLTLWTGGPLDGQFVGVPALQESFTVDPEGYQDIRDPMFLRRHRYVLTHETKLGMPIYRYAGIETE